MVPRSGSALAAHIPHPPSLPATLSGPSVPRLYLCSSVYRICSNNCPWLLLPQNPTSSAAYHPNFFCFLSPFPFPHANQSYLGSPYARTLPFRSDSYRNGSPGKTVFTHLGTRANRTSSSPSAGVGFWLRQSSVDHCTLIQPVSLSLLLSSALAPAIKSQYPTDVCQFHHTVAIISIALASDQLRWSHLSCERRTI